MQNQEDGTRTIELRRMVKVLAKPVTLDLDVNELRIIVGCLRLAAYQSEVENEPYLDPDGKALKDRLEHLYSRALEQNGSLDQAI